MDELSVSRGVGAAALASAWNRQTEALRRAVRDDHGYVLEDAMPVLDRTISVAAGKLGGCLRPVLPGGRTSAPSGGGASLACAF